MEMSKQVKIGGSVYRIEQVGNLNDDERVLFGHLNEWKKLIQINSDPCEQTQAQTLVHEIVHAMSNEYALEFNETTTERMASAVYAFIKENDWVILAIKKAGT